VVDGNAMKGNAMKGNAMNGYAMKGNAMNRVCTVFVKKLKIEKLI